MRLHKLTVSLAGTVVVLGLFLLGPSFSSYVRTAAKSMQDSIEESVPIETKQRVLSRRKKSLAADLQILEKTRD